MTSSGDQELVPTPEDRKVEFVSDPRKVGNQTPSLDDRLPGVDLGKSTAQLSPGTALLMHLESLCPVQDRAEADDADPLRKSVSESMVDLTVVCGESSCLSVNLSEVGRESEGCLDWRGVAEQKFPHGCGADLLVNCREPLMPPVEAGLEQDTPGSPHLTRISGCPAERTKMIINRVLLNAVSIRALVSVCGRNLKAVVDSGAEVSVMSCEEYRLLPESCRPKLREPHLDIVVADKSHRLATLGIAQLEFTIMDHCFSWPMYIAPISDGLLFGCYLLDAYDWSVNSRRGLLIGNSWIPCEVTRRPLSVCRATVYTKNTIDIAAEHEIVVSLPVNKTMLQDKRYAIVEPLVEDWRGLLMGRSLVDTWQETIPIRMINPTSEVVRIKAGYPMGDLEPFEDEVEILPGSDSVLIRQCSTEGVAETQSDGSDMGGRAGGPT